ncbi:glycosyltransferase [Desemzia sp. RIT804]|uniref:glycosyltransferase n=1 Tax=Desemzia sp. RIT 804 TaxID=2810209 RepID=UPI00194F5748|nr:glycosyltransferase [Desemzia sp. RIT 804]MBM6613283.1 glycosyltransferase [Desemzia sp. RIT 804]
MLILIVCFFTVTFLTGWIAFFRVSYLPKTIEMKKNAIISIIIPVRNEAENLPRLLRSLNQQYLQPKEIIVVDDDSKDCTVQIAKQFGAEVVKKSKEDSTFGKSAACYRGAKKASGEWLLFLDADTYLESPESLQRFAAAYYAQNGSGILSIQPYHTVRSYYESLSIVFNILVLAGMNVFTIFKDSFSTTGAFGPCLLCSREEYFLTGGHEVTQTSIMEDFVLGKRFQEQGFSLRLYAGKGVIHFRMYPEGFTQLVEGWSKNFAVASQSTHPIVLFLIACWITGGLGAGVFLFVSLTSSNSWLIAAGVIYMLYLAQFIIFATRVGRFHSLAMVVYPFLFLFFIILFSWSLIQTHLLGTVSWKGRKIKI